MDADIIDFWFQQTSPAQWWRKDAEFDRLLAERFGQLHYQAAQAELFGWRDTAQGRLAEVIVLDQFSRNIYRDRAQAFACDALALGLAQECVALGLDRELRLAQRRFLYMPYMHSESLLIHQQALKLFSQPGLEDNLDFEHKHMAIIERFGRYPHRNAVLGRASSAVEIAFLKQPGSAF